MALFTNKADKDLPLLTQFYQLEFDPKSLIGSEIDEWVSSDAEPGILWSDSKNASFKKLHDGVVEDLLLLARAHPTIKAVMESMADEVVPGEEIVRDLNALLTSLPHTQVDWVTVGGKPFLAEANQPWVSWPKKIYRSIIADLLELIEPMLYDAGATLPFARCEECKSPYVIIKKRQSYCSTRCRHRNGQRRRMRELYAK